MNNSRHVLLDRDGVINYDSDEFIKSPDEWRALEGSLQAIALLNQQGYQVSVITNQSGVSRGLFDLSTLEAIHNKMRAELAVYGGELAAIYYCPHGPDSECLCRKPKPGMMYAFQQATQIPFNDVYVIGDAWRDIQTAVAVGAKPILVKTGKGLQTLAAHPEIAIPIFENLYAAAEYIITQQKL